MLERVITDKDFSERMERLPLQVLTESGFDLRDDIARQVESRTISELQKFDPLGPVANVAVSVGIDVGVVVMINVGIHTKARSFGSETINPVIRDRVLDIVEERLEVQKHLAKPRSF
jgi:hypothetical protein